MSETHRTRYEIELLCDYPGWWRYNVYIMAVGFAEKGGQGTFNNLVDKVPDTAGDGRLVAPAGCPLPRTIRLTTQECAFADIYIYVVADTFPATNIIGEWPPFEATLRVSAGGIPVVERTCEVNQWGGLTVVALRADIFND